MKVGDLVIFFYADSEFDTDLGAGLITGFDKDNDPIVRFTGREGIGSPMGDAYLKKDIRVINESR